MIGYDEGEICNRDGCLGIIKLDPVENCSCHINSPCSQCIGPRLFCPMCYWSEKYDD